jgi:hypothetical protein
VKNRARAFNSKSSFDIETQCLFGTYTLSETASPKTGFDAEKSAPARDNISLRIENISYEHVKEIAVIGSLTTISEFSIARVTVSPYAAIKPLTPSLMPP